MRGKLNGNYWQHHDIPLGTCVRCRHKVYSDEEHERRSFIDASGNNDFEYYHEKCPLHVIKVIRTVRHYRCMDCGETAQSDDLYSTLFLNRHHNKKESGE